MEKMRFSSRTAGFTFAVMGMLSVGPDALLLRIQNEHGGTASIIGCWRYILLAIANGVGASLAAADGGPCALLSGIRRNPRAVLTASFLIVFINAGFTISLLKVNTAKALLLISLNPLWAALQGRLFLGDRLPAHTVVAQLSSLVSTIFVYTPNLLAAFDDDSEDTASDLFDAIDIVPLFTGFAVASFITFSRWQARASLEAAPALGAALTAVCAIVILLGVEGAPPEALVDGLQPLFWAALGLAALGSAVYDIALVIAPRSLTSAEVALIFLGETIFGPIWMWLFYGDVPDFWTLLGGGLLLATLIGHELASLLHAQRAEPPLRGTGVFSSGSDMGSDNGDFVLWGTSKASSRTDSNFASHASSPGASYLSLASIGAHRSPLAERALIGSRGSSAPGSRTQSQDRDGKDEPLLLDSPEARRGAVPRVNTDPLR